MIDYNNIISQLDINKIKNLLFELGAEEIIEKENYLITNTICHNIDGGSLKLYYYYDTHLFVCYTDEGPMNIFSFLKHYYETRNIEYDWYKDIFSVIKNCSNFNFDKKEFNRYVSKKDNYKKRPIPKLEIYDDNVLDTFIKYYPIEWIEDGISKEAMDRFNIKFSISQNKIIIPHYDVAGNLIGIRGRALNTEEIERYGKYAPIKVENTVYKHPLSLNLYGLYQNKDNINKYQILYLYEGEKSVLMHDSFNIPNCSVASCGSSLNIYQMKLLLKTCNIKEIVICYDKEEEKHSDKYFNKLWHLCDKYKNYCTFSFIYDRDNLLDQKDSPCDKGEEVFKKLFEKRVRFRKGN